MSQSIATFAVMGEARPDTLAGVVDLLTHLGLIPLGVHMRRLGDHALLTVVQDNLEPIRAAVLAEMMRALNPVIAVELTFQLRCESGNLR